MPSVLRVFFRINGLFLLFAALPAWAADEIPLYVPGRLLAAHRPGTDADLLDRTLKLHRAVVRRHSPRIAMSVLEVPEAASEAIMQSLQRTGLFEYVERDPYAHTAGTPNDPSFLSQWHLSKLQAAQAWNVTTGSPSVVVAVIDSGVYGSHPDLASQLVPGWNFLHSNANTSDLLGHGTAVAGAIGAASNNGIGVAGVSWLSRIMPLLVVDEHDFAAYSHIAEAILYAADHGIRIINISIGGNGQSAALQSAVDYAWSKGALIFAPAMNYSVSTRYYPAACDHVIAVSATDSNDHLASFSNYGNWIALAAPGTGILTTANGGGYGYLSGTSFSSPIAAGVAALILAINPSLTNVQLVSLLERSADDIGDPGYDTSFGWGRVNAFRAVAVASQEAPQGEKHAVIPNTIFPRRSRLP